MTGAAAAKSIVGITLDERTVVKRAPHIEHERAIAIFDLLGENHFRLLSRPEGGPFHLHLGVEDGRLMLDVQTPEPDCKPLERLVVSLQSFSKVIRDYFLVCESYYAAVGSATPAQIEAIDMGRRGLHNEASEMLIDRLADKVELDLDTARRLFTLICVLHIRG